MTNEIFEKLALVGVLILFLPLFIFLYGFALIHDAIIWIKYGPIPEDELQRLQWKGLA